MQLYSLIDGNGRDARAAFDCKRGSWVDNGNNRIYAQRVAGWARAKGLELRYVEANGFIALHSEAAGRYFCPEGPELRHFLKEVELLISLCRIRHAAASQQLQASTRRMDCNTIDMLLDELMGYFDERQDADDGIPNDAMKFLQAIDIAKRALERLGKS